MESMIQLLTREISLREADAKDVSLLLAARAELLLEKLGCLGACLSDCDQVLFTPESKIKAKLKVLPIRALILGFLGADDLAERDLVEFKELTIKAGPGDIPEEDNHMIFREDCPAAFVCNAADWHRSRRFAMIRRHPEVKSLYDSESDLIITCSLAIMLVVAHLICCYIASLSQFQNVVLLSCTLGAICAYGFQALTHELAHMAFHTHAKGNVAFVVAATASSLTSFPWHFYYWNYHNRHHAHAGGDRDRDGDILFKAWHSPPHFAAFDIGKYPLTRLMWTVFFAFCIYPMFCFAKATLDSPHIPSISYEGWNAAAHAIVFFLFGWNGLLYLVLSSAFSLGAFGHPFLQFWLTQHAFIMGRNCQSNAVREHMRSYLVPLLQPTCSSSTSFSMWHALNFGELRHVEHHDFPLIPYLRGYRLSQICEEFYSALEPALSPLEALKEWVLATGLLQKQWMNTKGDFAGRRHHLTKLWHLMQQEMMMDDIGDRMEEYEDSGGERASNVSEEEIERPWSPSEDVDDELGFVRWPTRSTAPSS
jgi:fatty acid desaturase